MKWLAPLALVLLLIGCSSHEGEHKMIAHHTQTDALHAGHGHHGKHAHHHGHDQGHPTATLFVRTEPAKPVAGQPATLRLMLHDAGGAMLKDFSVVHEARAHLMVVRDGLDHFAHLHPQIDAAGNITARFTFPSGGTYRLYADYQPTGQAPATATAELRVAGEVPPAKALTPEWH